MVKHGITSAFSLSALLFFAAAGSAAEAPAKSSPGASKSKPAALAAVAAASAGSKAPDSEAAGRKQPEDKAEAAKETLGDGFITQNTLRVYLARPATVTLHNARGQLLFQMESSRPLEALPLSGVTTGFLYLTLRAGQLELTKKLVYSGK